MDEAKRIRLIVDRLKDDPFLGPIIGRASPQGILMPFARERRKSYVVVGVFIAEHSFNRDTVAGICRRIIELLQSSALLSGLDGLEIIPSLIADGRCGRILRLSVLLSALPRAGQLTAADLEQREVAEGMTCILYKNIP